MAEEVKDIILEAPHAPVLTFDVEEAGTNEVAVVDSKPVKAVEIKEETSLTPEELAQMVREVNATQVSQEEQLSDHVYKYDAKTKTLSLADVEGLNQDITKVSEDKQAYDAVNTEVSRPRHHR